MEEINVKEKKKIKIGLSSVLCILLIIVIIALGCYMYVEKTNYDEEVKSLEANNVKMQSTINDLETKIVLMEESNNSKSNSTSVDNTTNTVENDEEMSDEEVDEIAEGLFEKGSKKIRESIYSDYSQYDLVVPSEEKVVKGKAYERRDVLYADIEDEYAEIFTDKALEAILKERFTESEGYLYVSSSDDDTEFNISNIKLERVSDSEDEVEYKVTYNDVEIDGTVSEELTCTMKIKLVDGEYRISEIDYCKLM